MKRLLCLTVSMDAGGAETFLMKIYRALDKSLYQMDFCINVEKKCFYEDEILSMGGKIYRITPKSCNLIKFRKQLFDVVYNNGYETVLRITSSAMGFMDLKIAKKAGAKICAARSSNSSDGGSVTAILAHMAGRLLYSRYVDVKIAPSDLAAKHTFGKKTYESGRVKILHNAVDLSVFHFDKVGREEVRKSLGIYSDKMVVGHIGRFSAQKNHSFLIDIFEEIHRKEKNAVLLLVGTGELVEKIKKKAADKNLLNSIVFAGVRTDINKMLSAMDIFVFPSLYEGMPNAVIEAQATGLPCLVSDTITRESSITELVKYFPLNTPSTAWADAALHLVRSERVNTYDDFVSNHYDIKSVINDFASCVFESKGKY